MLTGLGTTGVARSRVWRAARLTATAAREVVRSSALWRWAVRRQIWVWLLPVILYEGVKKEWAKLPKAMSLVAGSAVLIWVVRKYEKALTVLLVLLPFHLWIFAWLYKHGVPARIVRPARLWPELVVTAVAIVAVRNLRNRRSRLDVLDWVCLAYVALGLAYLFLPDVFIRNSFGRHVSFYNRELGWRSDVLYIGLFVAARHAGIGRQLADRLSKRFLASGLIVALLGIFEFFASSTFNRLAVRTFGVPRYQVNVLGTVPSGTTLTDIRVRGTFGGHGFVRVGSVLDYQSLAFFCAICLGLAAERIARGRARPWVVVSLPIFAVVILLTQTRSGMIAGVVALLVAMRAQVGRSIVKRVRLSLTLGLVAVAAIPFVLLAGVGHRFSSNGGSNIGHTRSYHAGIHTLAINPLGRGLSTSAGGGQHGTTGSATGTVGGGTNTGLIITEDQWLQIGTQLGYLGAGLYIVTWLLMIYKLRPRGPTLEPEDGLLAAGIRNALIGFAIGGTFLQPLTEQQISWPLFLLAGLGAAVLDRQREQVKGAPGANMLTPGNQDTPALSPVYQ